MNKDIIKMILEEFKNYQIIQEVNGSYEIKHDSLAAKVNFKRTTEGKKRIDATQLVYETHRNGGFLNEKQLAQIEPYLSKLSFKDSDKERLTKYIENCVKKVNDEKAAFENRVRTEKRLTEIALQQRNKARKFLIAASIGFILAGGLLILSYGMWYKDIRSNDMALFKNIQEQYKAGDQLKAFESIKTAEDWKYKNSIFSNIIYPGRKAILDSIMLLKKNNFFLDSFYFAPTPDSPDTLSKNRVFSYRPANLSFNTIIGLYKNGKIIFQDSAYIPVGFFSNSSSLFAYQNRNSIKVYDISKNSIVKTFELMKLEDLPKVSSVTLEFDSAQLYLYATINKNLLKVFDLKGDHYTSSGSTFFKFIDLNRIIEITPKISFDLINVWNLTNGTIQNFNVQSTQLKKLDDTGLKSEGDSIIAFPLYKANKIMLLGRDNVFRVLDIRKSQIIDSFQNITSGIYQKYEVSDSAFFPFYVNKKNLNQSSIIYNCLTNQIFDTLAGIASNINVSPNFNKILYLKDSVLFVKAFDNFIDSFPDFKQSLTAFRFLNNEPLFLIHDKKVNNYNLFFYNSQKEVSVLRIFPADKWMYDASVNKNRDELIFKSIFGYLGSLHLIKMSKKNEKVTRPEVH